MLSPIVKQLLRRATSEKEAYRELVDCPLGKLVSCQIALAVRDHATQITWGSPPDTEPKDADAEAIVTGHEEAMRGYSPLEDFLAESEDRSVFSADECAGVEFRRRDGMPEVASWQKVDGRWFRVPGIPVSLFAYVPQHLCERLVALRKTRDQGGRAEWIEHTVSVGEENRRFVRVGLVFEANRSVTIELLEGCMEGPDSEVVWQNCSV